MTWRRNHQVCAGFVSPRKGPGRKSVFRIPALETWARKTTLAVDCRIHFSGICFWKLIAGGRASGFDQLIEAARRHKKEFPQMEGCLRSLKNAASWKKKK